MALHQNGIILGLLGLAEQVRPGSRMSMPAQHHGCQQQACGMDRPSLDGSLHHAILLGCAVLFTQDLASSRCFSEEHGRRFLLHCWK